VTPAAAGCIFDAVARAASGHPMSRLRHLPMLVLAASACDCEALEAPPPPPQLINVRVHGEPCKPIGDAVILLDNKKVSSADAAGLGQVTLQGRYGDTFAVTVRCPKDYSSPEKPIQVGWKRLDDDSKAPEYTVACPPITRKVVTAGRAMNVRDLPTTYLGKEVARTDEGGAAHILFRFQPGDTFDLALETSDPRFSGLRPQNPVASFVVGQRDELFSFDQKFEEIRPAAARFAGPARPVKIVRQ
jgi:hypothetical protein